MRDTRGRFPDHGQASPQHGSPLTTALAFLHHCCRCWVNDEYYAAFYGLVIAAMSLSFLWSTKSILWLNKVMKLLEGSERPAALAQLRR